MSKPPFPPGGGGGGGSTPSSALDHLARGGGGAKSPSLPPLDHGVVNLYRRLCQTFPFMMRQRLSMASTSVVRQLHGSMKQHQQPVKMKGGAGVVALARNALGVLAMRDKQAKLYLQYVLAELLIGQYGGGGVPRGFGPWDELALDGGGGKARPLPGVLQHSIGKGPAGAGDSADETALELVLDCRRSLEKLAHADERTLHLIF